MTALSVVSDSPPNALQPRLPDGIHLRWGFERASGFPWYGYYLFRRPHQSADRSFTGADLSALQPGPVGATTLSTNAGELSSDVALVLSDDFPPAGAAEVDLAGRGYVRFVPADLASEIEFEIGFRQRAEIVVTGFLQNIPVAVVAVRREAGQTATVTVKFDALSSVEVSGGPAALIALKFLAISQGATAGWQPVPGFQYPLELPVSHPDYPLSSSSSADAETLGVGRVVYGLASPWSGARFAGLHSQLQALVDGGPSGPPMASKTASVTPVPPLANLTMPRQAPLDMVVLGALHPAVAQMLGLYWIDRSVGQADVYDYLVVADHSDVLGRDPAKALQFLRTNGFTGVDGFIVFERSLADPAPALDQPGGVRSYAVPGGAQALAGTGPDAENAAALTWDLGKTESGALLPGRPVVYEVWRADLGSTTPSTPPSSYDHVTKSGSVLVVDPQAGAAPPPAPPPDWPPFRLHFLDAGLAEGWYAYQVSGVDVFGRHSAGSAAAPWFQWTPRPVPKPWYYQDPPGAKQIHPFAVALLDKVPPPPPTGIEAHALDAADPLLVKDSTYTSWFNALPQAERSVVGLRVRWLWTHEQMQQAPDTREFRIYYQPGRLNAVVGNTTAVTAAGSTETTVDTDIPNARAAGAYVGARLLIGLDGFEILASDATTPLRVRVRNLGPQKTVRPAASAPCSVSIPSGHALFTDFSRSTEWSERYYVVAYDDANHMVETTDAVTGKKLRTYDVLLPAAGDVYRAGVPLAPSAAEPVVFAHVGVSAADDKAHTSDDPRWAAGRWGGASRYGNEGAVGQPATIFRVHRTPPSPPVPPPFDSDRVWATTADYHGQSYYTFRWLPAPNVRLHVFRALDEAVFDTDWSQPTPWGPLNPANAVDRAFFPTETRWDTLKLQQVATELNQLRALKVGNATKAQGLAAYRSLSNDAARVLAGLPGTERAFTQLTIQPLDPSAPENADRRGPDSPAAYTPNAGHRAYLDALDGRAANRYFYRGAYVDGAQNRSALGLSTPPIWLPDFRPPLTPRLLKALGGNRSVTVHWAAQLEPGLDRTLIYRAERPEDGADVRLMGAPVADLPAVVLVVSAGEVELGAGTDVVSAERVYASAAFDPTKDLLTGQTATQYLPNPTALTGTKVIGLTAPNGTAVVVVYRDSRQGLQYTPWSNRPRVWVDEGLAGPRTYYYRVIATRRGETPAGTVSNRSQASELGAGRAIDQTPPTPPAISTITWVRVDPDGTVYPYGDPIPAGEVRVPAVELVWTSTDPDLMSLVQYEQSPGGGFVNASGWLPRGVYEFVHPNEFAFQAQTYRLKVLSAAGNANTTYAPASLPAAP